MPGNQFKQGALLIPGTLFVLAFVSAIEAFRSHSTSALFGSVLSFGMACFVTIAHLQGQKLSGRNLRNAGLQPDREEGH